MIYTTSILALPLILLVWFVDVYLLLMTVYAVIGRFPGERAGQLRMCLGRFVEPIPQAVERWLKRNTAKSVKRWAAWAIVIALGVVVRRLAALMIVSIQMGHVVTQ